MWTLVRVLLGSVLLLGPRSGWGCELPATGQTTCWDSSGNVISCAGTGQDGDLQEGAPLAYVDNGDGTITDVNTGLVWEKLSNDGTVHDKDNAYTWANAFTGHVATLNSMNFAGHNDWRLPNVRELLSIANYEYILPSVSPAFDNNCASGCSVTTCSCTFSGDFRSSTSEVDGPSNAWFVDFQDGLVATGGKSGTGPVRAVRGGATSCPLPATGQTTCWNSSGSVISCAGTGQDGELREGAPLAYVDNGDGTVTDVNTGLVWEKLSDDGTVHDKDNTSTWANAFTGTWRCSTRSASRATAIGGCRTCGSCRAFWTTRPSTRRWPPRSTTTARRAATRPRAAARSRATTGRPRPASRARRARGTSASSTPT